MSSKGKGKAKESAATTSSDGKVGRRGVGGCNGLISWQTVAQCAVPTADDYKHRQWSSRPSAEAMLCRRGRIRPRCPSQLDLDIATSAEFATNGIDFAVCNR